MDKIFNAKTERQTIYDIYRGCRLCGGGAGYKMPIVQNVIDLDNNGVDLKQKIQECLQIQVHPDDKMPPLICELCVDKVNDFYEFMEMCRQINKRTRMRLGLPLQTVKKSVVSTASSDSGDCILGVTEPILVTDEDNEPLSKQLKKKKDIKKEKDDEPLSKSVKKKDGGKKNEKNKEVNVKKDTDVKVKVENEKPAPEQSETRKTRKGLSKSEPTPPRSRSTRTSLTSDDNVKFSTLKNTSKTQKSSPQACKPALRRELKELLDVKVQYSKEEDPRKKRAREKEPLAEKKAEKVEVPPKKLKISAPPKPATPAKPPPPRPAKPTPKPKPKLAPSLPPQHLCNICKVPHKSSQGLSNHMKVHIVGFTEEKLSCSPCGEWFCTNEESAAHHRKHKNRSYRCRHCSAGFRQLADYYGHFEAQNCKPFVELPDKKCPECWRQYPTQWLLDRHRCQGADGRPGGKCNKCNRMYTLLKNLKKHEVTCTFRKKGEAIIDPDVEKRLMEAQICLFKCDDVLTKVKGESYDVSDVDSDFGFDYKYIYPYRYRVKTEPNTGYDTMVAIGDEIKEYYSRNYVHWDSDDSDSDVEDRKRKIDSLTTICLKTIFSNRLLGKVPRRRRKVKVEKVFDNSDFDMSKDMDNIGKEEVKSKDSNDSDCSESIFGPFKNNVAITENVFDSLLENDSQDTEKNFELNNSEVNDCSKDRTETDSQFNDKVNSENQSIGNDFSKNDDDKTNEASTDDEEMNETSVVTDVCNDVIKNDKINETSTDVEEKGISDEANKTSAVTNNDCNDVSNNDEINETDNEERNGEETIQNDNSVTSNDFSENNDTVLGGIELSNLQDNYENVDSNTSENNVTPENSIEKSQIDITEHNVSENNFKETSDSTIGNNTESNIVHKPIESGISNEESNVKINGENKLNDDSDAEMDDKKLMDELDAQIGENNGNGDDFCDKNNSVDLELINDVNNIPESNNDQTEDFVENKTKAKVSDDFNTKKRDNLKGMDLDCISDDEFNFNA